MATSGPRTTKGILEPNLRRMMNHNRNFFPRFFHVLEKALEFTRPRPEPLLARTRGIRPDAGQLAHLPGNEEFN
jgi:hypothetical protein